MSVIRIKNTKEFGIVKFLFTKEGQRFTGVCLDFNIIEEGTDLEEVKKHLETAARLHLETVWKKNLSDDLLNRLAPEEYWEIYNKLQSTKFLESKLKKVQASTRADSYKKGELAFAC